MRRYKYGKLPPCDARLIYVEDVSIENCAVRSKKLGLHRRFVFHRASEEWLKRNHLLYFKLKNIQA